MTILTQKIGNAEAEWSVHTPLRWVIRETQGLGKHAREVVLSIDLTPLAEGYSADFLLALKVALIERRATASLSTLDSLQDKLCRALSACHKEVTKVCLEQALTPFRFYRIDRDFLTALAAVSESMPAVYARSIRELYSLEKYNQAIFSPDVRFGDLPNAGNFGTRERLKQNVIAQTLSQAILVELLTTTETAFEAGELNFDRYAFSRLLLNRAARPSTFRSLRCSDLIVERDGDVKLYFLRLTIPKSRAARPPVAVISVSREVGRLLEKQRESVCARNGYLVDAKNAKRKEEDQNSPLFTVGDLALFPACGETMSPVTQDRLGMIWTTAAFNSQYLGPLRTLTRQRITCTAMRHTIGTQLATAGCSTSTIAAVLLHATEHSARIYVDLIFHGAIDALSDSMQPAFSEHFPVYKEFVSASDEMAVEKAILSEALDRTKHEITGECGRDEICGYAPIACYDCARFKPAYDVDHTINLDVVTAELKTAQRSGLQRQVDVRRYSHIANRIRLVINLCDQKRASVLAA